MSWPTKKLGEVIYFQEGPGLRTFQFKSVGIRIINVANVREGFLDLSKTKFLDTAEVEQKYKHFLVNKDDILVSTSGTIGRAAWVEKENLPLMLNTSVVRFHTLDEKNLLNRFLFYFLSGSSFRNELLKYKTGVAIFNVGPSHLKKIKIPLPPLATQKQIVERLDKIAEAQKLNDGLIQKSDELFQSLLHQELNPAGKDWEVKKLKEICEINPSKSEINKLPESTVVSFLAMADVSEDAEITNKQERKLGEVKNGFTFFENEDVLVAKITPCFENGKGAFVENMVNGIGFGSTEFHVLRANQELLLNKLLYYLVSDKRFRKIGARFLTGSAGQQRVPTHYLENFKISLPPLETQKQIVAKLSAVQDYKAQLLAQKSKLKELFNSVLAKSFISKILI